MKYYADLHLWSGKVVTINIKPSDIDSIIAAVEGQFTFIDNVNKLTIRGDLIERADIYFKV